MVHNNLEKIINRTQEGIKRIRNTFAILTPIFVSGAVAVGLVGSMLLGVEKLEKLLDKQYHVVSKETVVDTIGTYVNATIIDKNILPTHIKGWSGLFGGSIEGEPYYTILAKDEKKEYVISITPSDEPYGPPEKNLTPSELDIIIKKGSRIMFPLEYRIKVEDEIKKVRRADNDTIITYEPHKEHTILGDYTRPGYTKKTLIGKVKEYSIVRVPINRIEIIK